MAASLRQLLEEAQHLHRQGQLVDAVSRYRRILRAEPGNAHVLHMLGAARLQQGKAEEAERTIRKALKVDPRSAVAHNNHGTALRALKRHDAAAASYRCAIKLKADYAEAHMNLGVVLSELGSFDEAIISLERALFLRPGSAEGYNNLGSALAQRHRYDEAVANYRLAIQIRPDYADAHHNLSGALSAMRLHGDALEVLQRAMQLRPVQDIAFGRLADLQTLICQWHGLDAIYRKVATRVRKGQVAVKPFAFLSMSDAPEMQLRCAQQHLRGLLPTALRRLAPHHPYGHERLRVAYVSADFHQHATALLMAELFERHDRQRFEISAVAFGPDDGSDMRRRLEQAFDRFIDVREQNDAAVAAHMRDLEIDIAVDLKGYTRDCRPLIFAHRPAPLQVNYLGFPATLGADFIDYILVDPFVVPSEQQHNFPEKIVHLPDCYQVNDSKRPIVERAPSRAECCLPEQGFVFCCFNNSYKITPPVFGVWMRLLQAVPGSVLWLLDDNPWATANLRREATERGVETERLVFGQRLEQAEHLARHRAAELFLDTLPVNAHTTASDALWAGLPVLTCAGESFAARVAGSLLHAIGLPELVTTSLADYEALALKLATAPDLLQDLRARLERNRLSKPLFRTDRFCRYVEAAYQEMHAIFAKGDAPRSFAVRPDA